MKSSWLVRWFAILCLVFSPSCRKTPKPGATPEQAEQAVPALRFALISALAGALEPCGCHKNMLGGLDHAAAFLEHERSQVPDTVLLTSGPTFFMNPTVDGQSETQELWKAESIAEGFRDLRLRALSLGANDFALGPAKLSQLLATTGAVALGRGGSDVGVPLQPVELLQVGGYRIGLVGGSVPNGAQVRDATRRGETELVASLQEGARILRQQGAQILIALVAADRGSALRVAESAPEFALLLLGKPVSVGEGNDGFKPPELVGKTLVVEAPNHLQGIAVVDFFVRGQNFEFADASGIHQEERRTSLLGRISELEARIGQWESQNSGSANGADLAARRADLERMKSELSKLAADSEAQRANAVAGSHFRYRVERVAESLGESPTMKARMQSYYRRVNEHNQTAFRDREPRAPAAGAAHYTGVAVCQECHAEAVEFWRSTRHAQAYQTLVSGFKEFNLDCVSCHVTGYEEPGGSTVTHVARLTDVQCENCHGPGSKHATDGETKLITLDPGRDRCKQCHHTPHVPDDWDVAQAWPKILGPGHGG